jgi:hypothetical protein
MSNNELISWLLKGDVSIQYQTHLDLLSEKKTDLQKRIQKEGWGKLLLSKRHVEGHWGERFYQPKWTSSHYTLLDLKNLGISPDLKEIKTSIQQIIETHKSPDGGILPIGEIQLSDVCINGMFLNYASYFGAKENDLKSVVDCILDQHMADGGFNCRSNRSGAKHSSLHTTISILEGITEYQNAGYTYRNKALENAKALSIEFILLHQLFLSDRTGEIINKEFLKLRYPCRWKYDILRALDYFQHAKIPYDKRMKPALEHLLKKRNKDGTWNVNAKHPGQLHVEMEKAGKPSRWNTLRALRVLKHFDLMQNTP